MDGWDMGGGTSEDLRTQQEDNSGHFWEVRWGQGGQVLQRGPAPTTSQIHKCQTHSKGGQLYTQKVFPLN